MLTRIRNANSSKHKTVDVPASNIKLGIAEILFKEGYIKSFEEIKDDNQGIIRITLKYDEKGTRVIDGLRRISKPGLRVYASKEDLPQVLNVFIQITIHMLKLLHLHLIGELLYLFLTL